MTASAGQRLKALFNDAVERPREDWPSLVVGDIKPENIFLTSDGRIKVLDFGIAKLLDGEPAANGTVAGAMMGTLDCMTPEQVRGEDPCARTDVYACGVVLYELHRTVTATTLDQRVPSHTAR